MSETFSTGSRFKAFINIKKMERNQDSKHPPEMACFKLLSLTSPSFRLHGGLGPRAELCCIYQPISLLRSFRILTGVLDCNEPVEGLTQALNGKVMVSSSLDGNQTWLAEKSTRNGGFNRKVTDKWSIFQQAMFDYRRVNHIEIVIVHFP